MTLVAAILVTLLAQPSQVRACQEGYCAGWAQEVADACELAGTALEVDPWLLASIAHAETRFDPERRSPTGKGAGLWGLHPGSKHGRRAAAWCEADPDRCLLAHAIEAAAYLNTERRRCRGINGALRSYGSGRCAGPQKYPRTVAYSMARLKGQR